MPQNRSYALVRDGIVHEIITTDQSIQTQFHPEMPWVPVPPGVTVSVGHACDGACFTAPPPPKRFVPSRAGRFQFRHALRHTPDPADPDHALFDRVNAWCATYAGDLREAWDEAAEFSRSGLLVKHAATALSLSDDLLDALFIASGQVVA